MDSGREYLMTKLNPILEPMVTEALMQKPNDPIEFMINWLQKLKKPAKSTANKKIVEIKKREEKKEVDSEEDKSSDDEEEDQAPVPIPVVAKSRPSTARKAISAEAYGDWNKKQDFIARVIQKNEDQKKRIRGKLQTSFIFNALDPRELEIVVGAMEEKPFQPGQVVIKQGDEGDNLYVVESGKLTCVRQFAKDQEPKFLKEYEPGEAFGELALLYNAPRAATITAKTECTLWSLDRPTFTNIVKDAAIKKRNKYEEFLKSVPILKTIESYELIKIMDAVKPIEYTSGQEIITEGDEGNVFFLLESGEAYAQKIVEPGSPAVTVMEYSKGSYFGELALLKNSKRAATVIAKTNCVCLTLDRHSFKRLLGPLDEILKRNMDSYNQYTAKI